MYKRLLCLIIITAFTASAWADDVEAPLWRGDPQSMMAQWTFDDENAVGWGEWEFDTWEGEWIPVMGTELGLPEITSGNPGPLVSNFAWGGKASADWSNWADPTYLASIGERTGIWDMAFFTMYMENFDDGKPFKDIRVQVTYYTAGGDPGPEGSEIWGGAPGWSWNGYDLTGGTDREGDGYMSTPSTATVDHGDGWATEVWDLHIEPNPEDEWIDLGAWWSIEAGTPETAIVVHMYVDQVVIDTISYPEPATVALLGLGSLALIRRKRK